MSPVMSKSFVTAVEKIGNTSGIRTGEGEMEVVLVVVVFDDRCDEVLEEVDNEADADEDESSLPISHVSKQIAVRAYRRPF